jgi:hypothetical protein
MLDLGVRANLMGTLGEFLAQGLDYFHTSQALDTLENMDLEFVPRGGIKLPIEVFFCEFVPMQLLTLHSAPR